MTNPKPNSVLNDAIRSATTGHRVTVHPTTTRAALNTAIRRAAGREPDDGTDSPGPYPWRSLTGDRDEPALDSYREVNES